MNISNPSLIQKASLNNIKKNLEVWNKEKNNCYKGSIVLMNFWKKKMNSFNSKNRSMCAKFLT